MAAVSAPPNVDRGPGVIAVSWVEASIGIVVLTARMFTRGKIIRKFGADDWTMVLATVLAVVTTILATLEVSYGVGRHAAYLEPSNIPKAVEVIWLTVPFSTMSACFGKISIALLLMRIVTHNRGTIIFLWTLIVLLFLINLLLTIITFAQCKPVTFLWDRTNPNAGYQGTCWSPSIQQDYGYFQGAFSSLSDLILALFPITFIWRLQVALKLKFGLAALMGLGLIATVASVFKTVELKNLATPDFTFDATDLVYWYITENWLIIITACIPTLGPLYMIAAGQKTLADYSKGGRQYDESQRSSGWRKIKWPLKSSGQTTGASATLASSSEHRELNSWKGQKGMDMTYDSADVHKSHASVVESNAEREHNAVKDDAATDGDAQGIHVRTDWSVV